MMTDGWMDKQNLTTFLYQDIHCQYLFERKLKLVVFGRRNNSIYRKTKCKCTIWFSPIDLSHRLMRTIVKIMSHPLLIRLFFLLLAAGAGRKQCIWYTITVYRFPSWGHTKTTCRKTGRHRRQSTPIISVRDILIQLYVRSSIVCMCHKN